MALLAGETENAGLEMYGFGPVHKANRNLTIAPLFEEAIRRSEGLAAVRGPLVVRTGKHTGRSPNDKFFVQEPSSQSHIDWGKTNKPFDQAKFNALLARVDQYLRDKEVFVLDAFAGADPEYRIPVRVVTELAWHNLFARNLFIPAAGHALRGFEPEFAVVNACNFLAAPERDGTRSETFIIINFAKRLVLIGGTTYAGEIKKSVFTIMNYLLPAARRAAHALLRQRGRGRRRGALLRALGHGQDDPLRRPGPRRSSATTSTAGATTASSTSKAAATPKSSTSPPEPSRRSTRDPDVRHRARERRHRPASRELDLDDASLTENTRAAYPLDLHRQRPCRPRRRSSATTSSC